MQFSQKVSAIDPPKVLFSEEDEEKVLTFFKRFQELASTYTYDPEFADNQRQSQQIKPIMDEYKNFSLNMLDTHKKGSCLDFVWAVQRELDNLGIENWTVSDLNSNNKLNIYINPMDRRLYLADLGREMTFIEHLPSAIKFPKWISQKEIQKFINQISCRATYSHLDIKTYIEENKDFNKRNTEIREENRQRLKALLTQLGESDDSIRDLSYEDCIQVWCEDSVISIRDFEKMLHEKGKISFKVFS